MYVYVYKYIHVYIYIYTYSHINLYVYVGHTCIYMCVFMYLYALKNKVVMMNLSFKLHNNLQLKKI